MQGQFSAQNMSRAARQAARYRGLSTVGSYDILSHTKIVDGTDDANKEGVVVIRAYSPAGAKVADITAGDIYMMETMYQEAPLARVK